MTAGAGISASLGVSAAKAVALAIAATITATGLAFWSNPAAAQLLIDTPGPGNAGIAEDRPALITADELVYEDELGIITASGNVEIAQDASVLLADSVSYNQNTEIVVASGNVSLLNENGDVYFSEYAELTGDLQEGFIQGIRSLMSDGLTRVAAARGIRTTDNRTVFDDAVYSPCPLCRSNPDRPPIWQLSARKVIHDQEAREVRYRDATLDVFGVPVFYMPYFEHPDPTVNRKSGLLTASWRSTEFLGFQATTPYFWVIDDNIDATITPTFTTKQNPYLNLEYRHRFPAGAIELRGSGTIADRENRDGEIDQDRFRGHIDANGNFTLDSRWRTGFNIFRVSDDTYDQLYDLDVPETRARTESNVFVEGFGGRNYFTANAFSYQSLRSEEDDDVQPLILPELDFNYVSQPLVANSLLTADANLLYLTRQQGRRMARASLVTGWTLPYTSDWGDVWTFRTSLQTDGYWTEGNDPDNPNDLDPQNGEDADSVFRAFPQASLEWRYPWAIQSGGWEQIIEPIAQFVAAPNGNWFNRGDIPNEDSLGFEFDDTTLFAPNRFSGLDRVDPGVRADYGLQYTLYTGEESFSQVFLGQSWRLSDTDVFAEGSGVEGDGASDIVGRVIFSPISEIYTAYRFRLDQESLEARVQEVTAGFGNQTLRLELDYTFTASQERDGGFAERETAGLTVSSRLSENWFVRGRIEQDLAANELQTASASLTYTDECLLVSLSVEERNFDDRDIESDTRFLLTIGLAQLGQFETGFDGGSGEE
ncbi:LPS-assembly protein LptD [Algihabitans albus]|uniref:LPS-assembly protein LptD n=1 Tax=Algihabitans albus TaxID=2164067 RepID=UPI0013C308B1|nr:LPS assembly protein LptD [Algihabitans albus]